MGFKCNINGLSGVTDGEHDVRELIEYYSNSKTTSSLYRYRDNSTRIGQTTPDRNTIKDRWDSYIPVMDDYIKFKRNGVSDSLMPPGYFTTFEKMAQVTGGTNGQTVTIASNSSGQLTYTNSGAAYILSRTGFNNASIAPKFIYLIVQATGGHGGYGYNGIGSAGGAGGGGGAGAFCAICLSLTNYLCGNLLEPNITFATLTLGAQCPKRDSGSSAQINGPDSIIQIGNTRITLEGGQGGQKIDLNATNSARGYGGHCICANRDLDTFNTMNDILDYIGNDNIIAIYPGAGCSGGDRSTNSSDPEVYIPSGSLMAESCSSDISNLTCPGYSGARQNTAGGGFPGWGGGASFFSNGRPGLSDDPGKNSSSDYNRSGYGNGGGGGASMWFGDEKCRLGSPGGDSILRIYY